MSLRVAVIGAGPAGIYASDLLIRNEEHDIYVDLFEQMPAPFGLIRYGVAPDHPRIKGIVKSLHNVLDKPHLRLLGNITIGDTATGADLTIDELREYYDAIVISTGAVRDKALTIPGGEHSIGAGEFVGFYDGNPRFERDWDLSARQVAVIGVGNVGLDIARILAKTGDELLVTEIPDNVYASLSTNQAEEVHLFGRRGPAQAKFTPKELKELDLSDTINVVVSPEDIEYDEHSVAARRANKSVDLNCQVLEQYALREPKNAPHTLHIHFFEEPTEVLLAQDGENDKQTIVGLRTERQEYDGNGNVVGTGKYTDWPAQAVYHAIGYRSEPLPGVPFDYERNVIPSESGQGKVEDGLYVTGWIKRGPVGLIGNTKSDAKETTDLLVNDALSGRLTPRQHDDPDAIIALLEQRDIPYTTWEGWYRLDAAERAAGEGCEIYGRERKKIVEWEDMVTYARAVPVVS
ncbi:FAD-dependent oxidoreductase [Corynebacterium cystitidis]|uniref:ferredoxin--NADP(+) reductase n=1 Tax=Corynebacterium cystitidis DSM 20524 TaxID=1121357 RepID=A0A1H9T629_9CORY|nr:NADPH-ferredoxin reductase FprA [Corynebacterium cystitidis DSM 20524]SER92631.1 ferredoxin--NADP+ reductase [Corynebacterium cystitidis DSM 20524]SNV92627.1 ferredoxin/ferredoxin--NADP reductase [Corynebacterium cystitidis]